jgi:hypothetical protein
LKGKRMKERQRKEKRPKINTETKSNH